jgi:hypothetical protein
LKIQRLSSNWKFRLEISKKSLNNAKQECSKFKHNHELAEHQNKVYFKKQAEIKNENKELKAELEAESTRLKNQIKKNNAKFQKTCEELMRKRLKADEEKKEYHTQLQTCREDLANYQK